MSQYDAEFTFSPCFWKWAKSTPWESQNKVSITFPIRWHAHNHKLFGWRWTGMSPLHWSMLWFRLVVMCSWFIPSYNPVKQSSPSSAYRKRCCKDRPICFIFSHSFISLGTHCAHIFRNLKWSCVMLYATPWKNPSAVATLSVVILLSAQMNSSTHCTYASVTISTGRPGWESSATFEYTWENFWTQFWTTLHNKHFTL
jgi:hypothetical protein